jgi:glyoxylate reductase
VLANYEPANHEMFGAREVSLRKPAACFIDGGRGRLVDEEARIQALRSGTIAGAGLEVYYDEPPVGVEPRIPDALIEMENVVLQPHNGGATWDSRSRQTMGIALAITQDIERRMAGDRATESVA